MTPTREMIARSKDVAAQLKLLSNPNRLMIVCRLLEGEMSVGDIEADLGIGQPTLSRELGHLRDSGVIAPRRQSKVVFYGLSDASMTRLITAICGVYSSAAPASPAKTSAPLPDFNPRPKFNVPIPSLAHPISTSLPSRAKNGVLT